jgi:excisionase family DNA binding protein
MQNNSTLLHQTTPEGLVELMLISFRAELQSFKNELAPAPASEELLTKKEVCELLKVKAVTIWRWQKEGKINSYGIGKNRYYKKAEILELLTLVKR